MLRNFFLLIILFRLSSAAAQIGGKNSFEFVDMAVNAHAAGIGGVNVSVRDQDVNMILQNPALLNNDMFKNLSLSYLPFYAGVKATSVVYGHDFGKNGKYAGGLQYFNYGEIKYTDETGNDLGTFQPAEYVFTFSSAHTLNYYTLGASFKFAGANVGSYSSYAIMGDFGGVFKHPKRDFTIGLVAKNIGGVLKKFTGEAPVSLPFDVQVGATYKLEHMPLRFSLTAHHLNKFDIVYLDPTQKGVVDLEGNEIKPKKTFADKLARHFVLGGEFILGKGFHLRFGYNYLRRKELRLQTKSGGAGFSFGFMMRVKSFEIGYTKAYYHVAGGANYLTITTNFGKLIRKKKQ
ncbi:MAG: type IX secretion system protein PorQ [Cytophagaceae bacterium]|nr:type IX secretion system protein PorQ [Cytophagaceae bacterium]